MFSHCVLVPKKAPLTTAIKNGDVVAVKNLLSMGQVDENSKKKMKLDTMSDLNPVGNEIETKSMFGEYCNGNQNVMHIAVANIIKTSVKCKDSFCCLRVICQM